MSNPGERRVRRAQGQRLLDSLAADYVGRAEVDRARMFGSTGLRVGGKFFAFVGTDGELIVKMPAVRSAALRATGEATAVRVGRNAAREWVSFSATVDDEPTGLWRAVLSEAYHYGASLSPAPTDVNTGADPGP